MRTNEFGRDWRCTAAPGRQLLRGSEGRYTVIERLLKRKTLSSMRAGPSSDVDLSVQRSRQEEDLLDDLMTAQGRSLLCDCRQRFRQGFGNFSLRVDRLIG